MYEVGAAIVGGVFLLVSVFVNIRYERKFKTLRQQDERLEISRDVFEGLSDFETFNRLRIAIDEVFQETKADRFLLMVAVNKKTDFNDITVVYEQHEKVDTHYNAIARYAHISVDDEYRSMLKDAEANGSVVLKSTSMDNCLLKSIYDIEGVKHSVVNFISRHSIDKNNDAVIYSSLATHQEDEFKADELVRFRLKFDSTITPVVKSLFL